VPRRRPQWVSAFAETEDLPESFELMRETRVAFAPDVVRCSEQRLEVIQELSIMTAQVIFLS
jgi:hypothetical protein